MADVAVLGAGAFGTALAVTLARQQHSVTLCARRPEHRDEMASRRENQTYLPGIMLPSALQLSTDWTSAVADSKFVVMAVPSRFARAAIEPIISHVRAEAILVSVTKGIEQESLLTISRMLTALGPRTSMIAAISGPAFAMEIARGKPAALVAAAVDRSVAVAVQQLFAGPRLRLYSSSDVIGVELGGAAKNVIAIAAGIADGLDLGSSARAGLITRGIAEMMRLALAAGGRSETIAGLAGLGDLVLTCTSNLSRNRRLGLAIARGKSRPEAASGKPIAEGMTNSASIRMLAGRLGVEMPIVDAVYRVLYSGLTANAMVDELLSRGLKAEF